MSKHRESAVQSIPSDGNVLQPSPENYPQTIDWFAETERMRAEREKSGIDPQRMEYRPKAAHCILPELERPIYTDKPSALPQIDASFAVMTFAEIGRELGMSEKHTQQVFYHGMKKLVRRRKSPSLVQLHKLMLLYRTLADRRELVEHTR